MSVPSGQAVPSTSANPRYVVISPVRDEAENIENTIESMLRQTITPVEWMIVNDGSTDSTGQILDKYKSRIPWISAVHRDNRGFREPGGGVVAAFEDGYRSLTAKQWDYIVKLDGDLTFEPQYFEKCFERFAENPKLGVGGGTIQSLYPQGMIVEKVPEFHVRGATKIYRRNCWERIGGLLKAPGWDTLDEVKANMLGWETRSFPDIVITQQRVTGGAEGQWRDSFKNGRANYICGYHPFFMVLKCMRRLFHPRHFVSAFGLMSGFISGYVTGEARVDDPELIRYLRKQQLKRLTFSETIWK